MPLIALSLGIVILNTFAPAQQNDGQNIHLKDLGYE
jgi:hypothetical protein